MPILSDENVRIQYLSTGKQMDSRKIQRVVGKNRVHCFRKKFLINSKRCRSSSHTHGAALCPAHWVDTYGHVRSHSYTTRDCADALHFNKRFQMDFPDPA